MSDELDVGPGMRRYVTANEYEIFIEAEERRDHFRLAKAKEYKVHYTIVRTDSSAVRNDLASVHSYDLIDGNDYFNSIEAALDYGEAKAREDVSTFAAKVKRTHRAYPRVLDN